MQSEDFLSMVDKFVRENQRFSRPGIPDINDLAKIRESYLAKYNPLKPARHKCHCSTKDLLITGCQCGGC